MFLRSPPSDGFTRGQVIRMTGITPRQFGQWQRLGLLGSLGGESQTAAPGTRAYTFADLVCLRTIKQLIQEGISPKQLCRALISLRAMFEDVDEPLQEMRMVWDGHRLAVEYQGNAIEPISGQLLLRFTSDGDKLRVMPERTPEQWLEIALGAEGDPDLRPLAIEAYQHVVEAAPAWAQPLINLGTLLHEAGNLEMALDCYAKAILVAPEDPLAHFNLGSVLDEQKRFAEAAQHLKEAVRLKPDYADAHYNLARVYDELGSPARARPHWQAYLKLDPESAWSDFARQRLAIDPADATCR